MSDDIFVATAGAVAFIGGRRITIQEGATARAGHPILEGREHLFAPLQVDFDLDDDPAAEPEQPADGAPAAKDVRAWAKEQGIEVPARGALPADLYAQYQAAHQEA